MGGGEYNYKVELVCEHIVISTLLITDIEPDSEEGRYEGESRDETIVREACAKIEQEYGIDPYLWVIYTNIEYEGSLL
jgi:hypothetical protein